MMKFFVLNLVVFIGLGTYLILSTGHQIENKTVASELIIASEPVRKEPIQNKQIIRAWITDEEGLSPKSFIVKMGSPIRFEITPEVDVDGCMSTIMIPGLFEEPFFIQANKKIIMEFIPSKPGTYDITCAMGMPWGEIIIKN